MQHPKQAPAARPPRKRGDGEGSIDEVRAGLWRGRLMVGYQPDGKPDRRVVYGKTRAEVQRKVRDLQRQAEQGILPQRQKLTVAELLALWLEDGKARGLRPKTLANYRQMADVYLAPGLGRRPLASLRPEHIAAFCADLIGRGLAATTVRYLRHLLHGALKLAVRRDLVARNVADAVSAPRRQRRELAPPSAAEVAVLLDGAAAAGDRLHPLWTVAVFSGCRPGELLGLQWPDVDWAAATVTIRRALAAVPGQPLRLAEPKTERGRRTVTLAEEAMRALQAQRKRQLEERLALGAEYDDHGLVFATHLGRPLHPNNVLRDFKLALKRAGLPTTYRFYDLRHTHATTLFAEREHPKVVSERLGHSSVALTLDTYTHLVPGLDNNAAAKVQRAIRGARQAEGRRGTEETAG